MRGGNGRGRGGAYRLNSQSTSLRLDAGSARSSLSSTTNTAFPRRDKERGPGVASEVYSEIIIRNAEGRGSGQGLTACRELILLLSALLLSERLPRTAHKPVRHVALQRTGIAPLSTCVSRWCLSDVVGLAGSQMVELPYKRQRLAERQVVRCGVEENE